jgi:hypothetical protein
MTPERKAQLLAELEEIVGPRPLPRPKVVTRDGATIRDADVHVSAADPNARGADRVVAVRRRPNWFVTINMPEAERQWAERRAEREAAIQRFEASCRLPLYGSPFDDD